jgi:hypothetical protein
VRRTIGEKINGWKNTEEYWKINVDSAACLKLGDYCLCFDTYLHAILQHER